MKNKSDLTQTDHFRGSPDARVTLIEYGDYECPFCAQAFPILERLVEDSGDDLCFIYRHFPITHVHPHSELAARSAEAAGLQGKYWEMHQLLFENYDQLSEVSIAAVADRLELDWERFKGDIDNASVIEKVRSDFSTGLRSGVNGTPSLFFNGMRYDGPRTLPELRKTVEVLAQGGEVVGL